MGATLILLSQINARHRGGGGSEFKLNWWYLSVLKQLGDNGMPTVTVDEYTHKRGDRSDSAKYSFFFVLKAGGDSVSEKQWWKDYLEAQLTARPEYNHRFCQWDALM